MPLNVYIISSESPKPHNIKTEDFEIVDILGKKDETLAIRAEEVFNSIIPSISKKIDAESELIIELTGSVLLEAKGNANYFFINLGGTATKKDEIKITLKTKINQIKP